MEEEVRKGGRIRGYGGDPPEVRLSHARFIELISALLAAEGQADSQESLALEVERGRRELEASRYGPISNLDDFYQELDYQRYEAGMKGQIAEGADRRTTEARRRIEDSISALHREGMPTGVWVKYDRRAFALEERGNTITLYRAPWEWVGVSGSAPSIEEVRGELARRVESVEDARSAWANMAGAVGAYSLLWAVVGAVSGLLTGMTGMEALGAALIVGVAVGAAVTFSETVIASMICLWERSLELVNPRRLFEDAGSLSAELTEASREVATGEIAPGQRWWAYRRLLDRRPWPGER